VRSSFTGMPPQVMLIAARSLSQAMDWSLVLMSQGIGAEIQQAETDSPWGLLVASEDYHNAVTAIRQYRSEDRGWPWQKEVFRAGLLFDWGSLAWVILLFLFYGLDAQLGLRGAGMMNTTAAASGQWWRLFTGILLHADLAHLAANATLGAVFLGLTMGKFGTGPGLLASYLAGVGGNLIAWFFSSGSVGSLGSSGMVTGSLGILAIQSLALRGRTPYARKYIVAGVLAGIMLFVLLGLSPGTYVPAHLGGFATGLVLGAILTFLPALVRNTAANLCCGAVFTLLVLLPWWLALSK